MEAEVAWRVRRERHEVLEEGMAVEETQGLEQSRIEWPSQPLLFDSRTTQFMCVVRKAFELEIFAFRISQGNIGILCNTASRSFYIGIGNDKALCANYIK